MRVFCVRLNGKALVGFRKYLALLIFVVSALRRLLLVEGGFREDVRTVSITCGAKVLIRRNTFVIYPNNLPSLSPMILMLYLLYAL